jgi:hypothetical protein
MRAGRALGIGPVCALTLVRTALDSWDRGRSSVRGGERWGRSRDAASAGRARGGPADPSDHRVRRCGSRTGPAPPVVTQGHASSPVRLTHTDRFCGSWSIPTRSRLRGRRRTLAHAQARNPGCNLPPDMISAGCLRVTPSNALPTSTDPAGGSPAAPASSGTAGGLRQVGDLASPSRASRRRGASAITVDCTRLHAHVARASMPLGV